MAKFAEHLPLDRQAEIYARQGVELSRNMMGAGWISWESNFTHCTMS